MTNRGKRWHGGTSRIAITVAVGMLLNATTAFAQLSGGQVVGGQATIGGQGTSQTTITQTSDRAILNWDRFSLGAGDIAVFQQPDAKSITVNRVTGGDPSTIMGSIKANGQVVLINRNGVLFGKGSQVDTAGLIVSTHDIDALGFMRGDPLLRFNDGGNDKAEIVVEGRITIRDAGMAAFVAPHVRNSGLILADMGRVSLAAGKGFGIDLYGDGLVRFAAGDAITGTLTDSDGKPLKALVENDGTIAAQGGKILLTATAARDVVNASVNVAGIVRADSVSSQGGVITLSGSGGIGTESGSVISAAGATGGSVTITGGSVGLGGLVDASSTGARQAGGTIAVQSDGLLSLGGTTRAVSALGSGGSVTYQAARLFENSDGRTDVSGLIDGGTIRSIIADNAMISGRYFADGLYGLGGRIDMTATDLRLLSATVAATGRGGGGLVRLGGAFQGGKTPDASQSYNESFLGRWGVLPDLATAGHSFVNDGTVIDVRAATGRGGTAVVWSDAQTTFLGAIDARGSGDKGSGGAVEISSAQDLRRADLSHVQVGGGHLLLDPKNLIIGDLNSVQSWAYQGIIGKWYTMPGIAQLKAGDSFGSAVALNGAGDRLAIGAMDDQHGSGTGTGAVYLFSFSDSLFSGGTLQAIVGKGYSGGKNVNVTTLEVGDRFGTSVSLNGVGDRMAVGAYLDKGATNAVTDAGAVYLFSFNSASGATDFSGGTLQSTIGRGYQGSKDIDTASLNFPTYFGLGVSLNAVGDRLAVGSMTDMGKAGTGAGRGAAFLFSFNSTTASGVTTTDFSGGALLARIGSGYTGSGYTGARANDVNVALSDYDLFGRSVSLNGVGDRLAIGAYGNGGFNKDTTTAGAAYVFKFNAATTNGVTSTNFSGGQIDFIIGKDYAGNSGKDYNLSTLQAGSSFGIGVSLNKLGDLLAVGANGDKGNGQSAGNTTGAVYLFRSTITNGVFSQPVLKGTIGKGYSGNGSLDVANLEAGDQFGFSTSLSASGNQLAIGAIGDAGFNNASGATTGAAYLYTFTDGAFGGGTQRSIIGKGYYNTNNRDVPTLNVGDVFGSATALNGAGDRLAVGAWGDQSGTGAVYLFSFSDSLFSGGTLQGIVGKGYLGGKNVDVTNLEAVDRFGMAVSLNGVGDRMAVGAYLDDGTANAVTNAGAVYLFSFSDSLFSGGTLQSIIGSGYQGSKDINTASLNVPTYLGIGVVERGRRSPGGRLRL
jgi:filamentous hemagglutinin family protein